MRRATLFVLAGVVAACSGGNTGTNTPPPPPPPPPPAPVASVNVALTPGTVIVGTGSQANATVRDGNGNTLTGRTVAWSSGNPAVATVNTASGAITTVTPGTASITATVEGVVGTAQLTVNPRPVATVNVALGSPTLVPGATTAAIATTLDALGNTLTGRAVTWSSGNPAIATVAASGQVTAVSPGTTSIIATSEGITGSAQLTVTQPPVAQVQLFGTSRIKAGDPYQYTVEARLADGTLVQRPVSWSVPSGGATINGSGLLVATATGPLVVQATVEGVTVTGNLTSYDWQLVTSSGIISLFLAADVAVTNKFGTSEYPALAVACGSGIFLVAVTTQNFVTASGAVAYYFDGGPIISDFWIESSDFSTLGYPGGTNLSQKNFAALIALSSRFGFAFNEFQAGAHATEFRVTGLAARINTILSACPSNLLLAEDAVPMTAEDVMAQLVDHVSSNPDRIARSQVGPEEGSGGAAALLGAGFRREPVLLSQP